MSLFSVFSWQTPVGFSHSFTGWRQLIPPLSLTTFDPFSVFDGTPPPGTPHGYWTILVAAVLGPWAIVPTFPCLSSGHAVKGRLNRVFVPILTPISGVGGITLFSLFRVTFQRLTELPLSDYKESRISAGDQSYGFGWNPFPAFQHCLVSFLHCLLRITPHKETFATPDSRLMLPPSSRYGAFSSLIQDFSSPIVS